MRLLDSHLHLWDPGLFDYGWLKGPLQKKFAAEEIATAVVGLDVGFIFVQAECAPEQFLDEVSWISGLAGSVGVHGIVAGARLDRGESTRAHLAALSANPQVVGVRHLLQGEPEGFAATAVFREGIAAVAEHGWTFDACVRSHQIRDVTSLAEAFPQLKIVLDHLGKPDPSAVAAGEPMAEWSNDIAALASQPNVHVKLSGLPRDANGRWSAEKIEPFLQVAADAFGPERLMIGSDWPVSARRGAGIDPAAMVVWVDVVSGWAQDRGYGLGAILRDNAERFYGVTRTLG